MGELQEEGHRGGVDETWVQSLDGDDDDVVWLVMLDVCGEYGANARRRTHRIPCRLLERAVGRLQIGVVLAAVGERPGRKPIERVDAKRIRVGHGLPLVVPVA